MKLVNVSTPTQDSTAMRPNRAESYLKVILTFVTVFPITLLPSMAGAQAIQTLFSFNNSYVNGGYPTTALTVGNDGNFYGTTSAFYNNSNKLFHATVFKVTTNGTLTTLGLFEAESNPEAALTMGSDGNFYGTTANGGGSGTVFKVTTNGALTTLAYFSGGNGANPKAALVLGTDGNFYGTTQTGGTTNSAYPSGMGTVFQVTTNGALTVLSSFSLTNGYNPAAGLTLGSDGIFYGTTLFGGITNADRRGVGTVFSVTTNGTLKTLVYFDGSNGRYPEAPLALGSDGAFYGTSGGDYGAVFKVTTNGVLTSLVAFAKTNGAYPQAGLTLGSDGNFYGTTWGGGITNASFWSGMGTVFQVTTNGRLTTLAFFGGTNGANPCGLTLGNDGHLYGTTRYGGSSGAGTVFSLLTTPVITSQPKNQTNNAGTQVSFRVSTTATSVMDYQWQKNGTNLVDGGNIVGATTATLTITDISESDAGSYSVMITFQGSRVTSSNATLTVIAPPFITAQPTNLLVLPGTNAVFGVSLAGTAPFRYQWRFNGANLLNATSALYAIPVVATNNAGNYSVVITNSAGSATSSIAVLAVVLSPKSRTNYASSTATFTVTSFSPEPLKYQWQKNGINIDDGGNISGTSNSTLTITSVSDADAANYRAILGDAHGNSVTTSNAVLAINNFPFIALQPQSQTVVKKGLATFNVFVYGAPPFVFQWYFKGTPIGSPTTGTNFSSYTLASIGTNNAGNYSVQVINGYGSLMSSNAWLTVIDPPTLGLQILAGYPRLALDGTLRSNYVIQYSTNLSDTIWINLLSLTNLSASPYQFIDPAGTVAPVRFYRAVMQ